MTRALGFAVLVATVLPCFAAEDVTYAARWEFDEDAEGWQGRVMALEPEGGVLRLVVSDRDPWMISPGVEIDASRFTHLRLRLRAPKDSMAEVGLYWRTDLSPGWADPPKLSQFPIIADGEWHTYDVELGSPDWKGTVLQLRLDPEPSDVPPGTSVEVDDIGVYGLSWQGGLRLQPARLSVGQEGIVEATVRAVNRAAPGLAGRLDLPAGVELVAGDARPEARDLAMGEECRFQWRVQAQRPGDHAIRWEARAEGLTPIEKAASLLVTAGDPNLPASRPAAASAAKLDGGHVVLQNRRVRVTFVSSEGQYLHALVDVWDGGWQRMGSAYPLGEVVLQGSAAKAERLALAPRTAEVGEKNGRAEVRLRGSTRDGEGGAWAYELVASLEGGARDVWVTARLSCDRDRGVLRFAGPMVHAGDGSFGGKKGEAMFPGLEWLVGDEVSSSTLDLAPPLNMRYVPHPYRVTVPLMCVEDEGRVVGVAWDPLQKWDGENICPLAQFCSPNWINETDDHLMGLFVPGMPRWVEENKTTAYKPYELAAGKELALRSALVTGSRTTCLKTVWRYFELFGEFQAQEAPMSDEEEMALADETYLERLWSPGEASWIYCFPVSRSGGRALPASNGYFSRFALALWTDSVLRKDERAGTEVREQVQTALEAARRGNGHWYLDPDLAFRWGSVREAVLGAEHGIKDLIEAQLEDGSWGGFKPKETTKSLGPEGQREVGLCAGKAHSLLKYARITGNEEALAAGLKALAFMEQFSVPRAGQTWECPVHSPDIYASYLAIMPHLEAYRITGERKYLERAVYWAETGLPFVYVWGAPDRPVMKGGSIAIFGASYYTCSWLGRPVQWNGMEYSWALLKLAEYDQSRPWVELATSVMRSGMWQQEKDDSAEAKGGYTDNWDLPSNVRCTSFILSPWWILLNLHTLRGYDPDVQTAIVRTPRGDLRVSSGAGVKAELRGEDLGVSLDYAPGETVHCLVAGIAEPKGVAQGGRELLRRESLDEAEEGWSYLPERGFLLIRTRLGEDGRTRLEVSEARARAATWELGSVGRPAYKSVQQLRYEAMPFETAADWDFAREDGAKWRDVERSDLAEPRVEDGVLVLEATGPDPRLVLPIGRLDASRFSIVTVEMSADRGEQFELYFATEAEPGLAESRSLYVPIRADGEMHRYTGELGGRYGWEGTVTQLRFDPVGPVHEGITGARIRVKRLVISNKPL